MWTILPVICQQFYNYTQIKMLDNVKIFSVVDIYVGMIGS